MLGNPLKKIHIKTQRGRERRKEKQTNAGEHCTNGGQTMTEVLRGSTSACQNHWLTTVTLLKRLTGVPATRI